LRCSQTNGGVQDEGYASTTSLNYIANDLVWVWNTGIISKFYNPALGFIIRNDFLKNFIDIYLNKKNSNGFQNLYEAGNLVLLQIFIKI